MRCEINQHMWIADKEEIWICIIYHTEKSTWIRYEFEYDTDWMELSK